MLLSTLLLTFGLLQAPCTNHDVEEATPSTISCAEAPSSTWHVPGTPPPKPGRSKDTPPVIKDKPLPPV